MYFIVLVNSSSWFVCVSVRGQLQKILLHILWSLSYITSRILNDATIQYSFTVKVSKVCDLCVLHFCCHSVLYH